MIVLGLTETEKVYVDKSSDSDKFTFSEVKFFFVCSSILKASKFVDDHA